MGPVLELMLGGLVSRSRAAEDVEAHGGSPRHYRPAALCCPNPGPFSRNLGRFACRYSPPSSSILTSPLKRLQQRGFITRRPDPRDRRRAVFGLIAKRRSIDVEAEGTVEAAVRAAFEELPEAKISDAAEVLKKLTDLIEGRNCRTS
jgi:hypothetical protein